MMRYLLGTMLMFLSLTPITKAESSSPVDELSKSLTLPKMTMEPRAGLYLLRAYGTNYVALNAEAGFGITDKLEVGVGTAFMGSPVIPGFGIRYAGLPLILAPNFDIDDTTVYGAYDLSKYVEDVFGKDFQLAARLTINLPFSTDNFGMNLSAPLKWRFAKQFALIGDLGLGFFLGNADVFNIGLDAGILFQATQKVALLASFGMHIWTNNGSHVILPLALRSYFTISGPFDLYAEFIFTDLNNAGADVFQIIGGMRYRISFDK